MREDTGGGQPTSCPPDEGDAPQTITTGLRMSPNKNRDHHSRKPFCLSLN